MPYAMKKALTYSTPKKQSDDKMKMPFPEMARGGVGEIKGKEITYSYADSTGIPQTKTDFLLTADEILDKVYARTERFASLEPGVRESEFSRRERKWISSHPEKVLKEAWMKADSETLMELAMMLDMNSHYGSSSRKWLDEHAKIKTDIVGDDGKVL